MFESCPWDDISVPSQDINTRKVNCRLPVECFWGRDQSGGCNFIIELEGDHLEYFRRNRVLLNGILIIIRETLLLKIVRRDEETGSRIKRSDPK